MPDLKPCPAGCELHHVWRDDFDGVVHCLKCGFSAESRQAWNTRAVKVDWRKVWKELNAGCTGIFVGLFYNRDIQNAIRRAVNRQLGGK